jgi:hypothetical protein
MADERCNFDEFANDSATTAHLKRALTTAQLKSALSPPPSPAPRVPSAPSSPKKG